MEQPSDRSPEFAKLVRDAEVPEVTPEHTPAEVGPHANSQQFNQGKK